MSGELPTPALSPPRQRDELLRKINHLQDQINELKAVVAEHDDRLEVHTKKFEVSDELYRSLRETFHKMQTDLYRFADATTVNTASLERLSKGFASQAKSLELISNNTKLVLDRLQEKVTL